MKTNIVTGGAGFIGANLVKRLLQRGDQVFILDDFSTGFSRNVPKEATLFTVDISNFKDVQELNLPKKVDTIYHLAAQSSGEASFDDPSRDIDINYKGTYNILKLAEMMNCSRFIFSSSMSVYGEIIGETPVVSEDCACLPISFYGGNKLASEKLISIFSRNKEINPTIFRFFSVYGPGQNLSNMKQGIVSIYISFLMKNQPVHVKGSLDRFRDLIFIDDVVDVLVQAESSVATYNQVFNLGTGKKTTVEEILSALLNSFDKDDFNRWVRVEGSTPGDIKGCVADISKLHKCLAWTPKVGIIDGVKKMKSWADETADWWQQ